VNGDKTKYMIMSGDQNTERNNSIKIDNSFLKGWKNLFRKKLKAD
jgi:hypothetical protein